LLIRPANGRGVSELAGGALVVGTGVNAALWSDGAGLGSAGLDTPSLGSAAADGA
jgi:hypothetical protein